MRHIGKWALRIFGVTAIAFVAALSYAGWLAFSGNFHVVVQGELYRSAQIGWEDLAAYKQDLGIKSVLNLRGAHPGKAWYDEEKAAADAMGMTHVSVALSAAQIVDINQALELIALMRTLPKPILIHCMSGADRTGLVSALYLRGVAGADEAEAEGQLSFRFGHVAVPYLSYAYPMDESWEALEASLGLAKS